MFMSIYWILSIIPINRLVCHLCLGYLSKLLFDEFYFLSWNLFNWLLNDLKSNSEGNLRSWTYLFGSELQDLFWWSWVLCLMWRGILLYRMENMRESRTVKDRLSYNDDEQSAHRGYNYNTYCFKPCIFFLAWTCFLFTCQLPLNCTIDVHFIDIASNEHLPIFQWRHEDIQFWNSWCPKFSWRPLWKLENKSKGLYIKWKVLKLWNWNSLNTQINDLSYHLSASPDIILCCLISFRKNYWPYF